MKIIVFTHPSFLSHQSMPRFAQMIVKGMKDKGHDIKVWAPKAFFFNWAFKNHSLEKWFGYLDQFVVFPIQVKIRLLTSNRNTLFVFADNALGPWIPLVKNRSHVVHCHDFLAQKSAFGLLAENKTGRTGKFYQAFIRWGYRKASNFISISIKTQTDLHFFLNKVPKRSAVVYNGLNQNFEPASDISVLRKKIGEEHGVDLSKGYLLHVGGNAFYKNKTGVIEIFDEWVSEYNGDIPLILVGEAPTDSLKELREKSGASSAIYFINNTNDVQLQEWYQGASLMLFPSLYEGFGWPIVEAMASGCLVITTNEDPMKEVAGEAGFYIPKKPLSLEGIAQWKSQAAQKVDMIMQMSAVQRSAAVDQSISRSKKFSSQLFVDAIEKVYQQIITNE